MNEKLDGIIIGILLLLRLDGLDVGEHSIAFKSNLLRFVLAV